MMASRHAAILLLSENDRKDSLPYIGLSPYILMMVGQLFEDFAKGIEISAYIEIRNLPLSILLERGDLLGRSIGIRSTCSIGEGIGIAKAQIDELDIIVNASKQDIIGLQIEMEHLIMMKITEDIQQLTNELLRILLALEILGMTGKPLRKGHTIDILHQNAVLIK